MSLYHTAQNIEASALGQAIRESTWLFPAIESTHLLALALLGGSVLILSFSVLGIGLKTAPAELYMCARRYMNGALIVLLITGVLLAISEPVKLWPPGLLGKDDFAGNCPVGHLWRLQSSHQTRRLGIRHPRYRHADHRGMADGRHGGALDRILITKTQ